MTLALLLLAAACCCEVSLWWLANDTARGYLALTAILLMAVGSSALLAIWPALWSLLILIASAYRIVNLLRVTQRRVQADYLFRSVRRSSQWLIAAQLVILGIAVVADHARFSAAVYEYVLCAGQLLLTGVLIVSLRRHRRTSQPPRLTKAYADRDLPTLTVAIPARNETDDLEACLRSLVGSTYPKLEVLVLDDCSQNRRTPEIIRGFAHAGIRFIAGEVPPESWLAKNFAYQQLADAANGELILFCGVDGRFAPGSLRAVVETMFEKKKTMVSWLPVNQAPAGLQFEALFVQPGRYGWELALPRRAFRRPPILSSCWIIDSGRLRAAGGFKAVSHSISPESYFARRAITPDDGYSFLCADPAIGPSSAKSLQEQRATAIRTRYPQLHRRLELVAAVSLAESGLFVAPFISLVISLMHRNWSIAGCEAIICAGLAVLYARLIELTYRRFLIRGLWLAPFAALYDIALLNYSLAKYEFSEVIWKGRNVCVPLMRAIPKLPNLP